MLAVLQDSLVMDAIALLLVMRDMGNGVVRVERMAPLDNPLTVSIISGDLEELPFPLPGHILDAAKMAVEELGDQWGDISAGWARPVCDDITEVIIIR